MSIQKLYTVGGNLATLYNGSTALSMNWIDPYNPMDLPYHTFRLKYKPGTVPTPDETQIHPQGVVCERYDADENIWDVTCLDSLDYLMANDTNLVAILGGNLSGVTDLDSTFRSCTALSSTISLPYITGAADVFRGCSSLYSIPDNSFNNLIVAQRMFMNCKALSSMPANSFNNVTDSFTMFGGCNALTSNAIDFIESHTNMTSHDDCFKNCTAMSDYAQATALYPDWF